MEVEMAEEFNYCVGCPWKPEMGDDSSLSIYTYHGEVHYGTLEEAKNFREYVNNQTKEKNYIYKLVKLEEE